MQETAETYFKNGVAKTLLALIMKLACLGDGFLTKILATRETTDWAGMKADLHSTVQESVLNDLSTPTLN